MKTIKQIIKEEIQTNQFIEQVTLIENKFIEFFKQNNITMDKTKYNQFCNILFEFGDIAYNKGKSKIQS